VKASPLVATGLVLAAGVGLALVRPASKRLSPQDEAAWNRVVAALQQVVEEHHEALELEDPEASRRRRVQLAGLLDETSAFIAQVGPAAPELRPQVDAIRERVLGIDYRLGADSSALVTRILERTHLPRTPQLKPDLANGKRLFAQACAACHGSDGTGRTSPVAATMDPPPPDILHPQYNWSPYEMFNRVTYGGVETAMPSFEQGLTAGERWDIVFYLFAERWPPCLKPLPPVGADELAVSGDFELGNKFGYGAAACLRREFLPPSR
jgi:mono/diheme cytochrome c family protein